MPKRSTKRAAPKRQTAKGKKFPENREFAAAPSAFTGVNGGTPGYGNPPVETQFQKGVSGNPGGRPKRLGEAYAEWLGKVDETDPEKRTNAEVIAAKQGQMAKNGDTTAAREIRTATEGERIRTWRDDVIDLLKAGTITPDDVLTDLGEDLASELFIAAGVRRDGGREVQTPRHSAPASD